MHKQHPNYEADATIRKALVLAVTLNPGDVLYIPAGFLHEGQVPEADRKGSVHLTLAPRAISWAEFLHRTPFVQAAGQTRLPG